MKKLSLFGMAIFFLTACNQPKLEKEQAATVIRTGKEYPKVYEYEVNVTDPASAKKLLDAGLENAGLVTINRTQKLKNVGQPVVHFTDKAKPYLLHKDAKYDNVQVVKVADMDLEEISGIQMQDDNKSATVEYTVIYKNLTPFAELVQRDLSKPEIKRANLSLFDSGWKLDRAR